MTVHQSMPTVGNHPPNLILPARIPKLQVRSRDDEITPIPRTTLSPNTNRWPAERPSAITSSDGVNHTRSVSTSQTSLPPPQGRDTNGSLDSRSREKKGKSRGSVLGFLTLKEPSNSALQEFAEQQKRQAALKGSRQLGLAGVSQQKLPHTVPKVNSKWDGLPKVAHDKNRSSKGWERSPGSASAFGGHSKRSGQGSKSSVSSTGNSSGSSKRPSKDQLSRTHHVNGSISPATEASVTRPRSPKKGPYPTPISITPNGTLTSVRTGSADTITESPTTSSPLEPSPHGPEVSFLFPPRVSDIPKDLRINTYSQNNTPAPYPPLTPDDVFTTSPHSSSIGLAPIPKVSRFNSPDEVPQWPLPTNPEDVIIETSGSGALAPPIPAKSTKRRSPLSSPAISEGEGEPFKFDLTPWASGLGEHSPTIPVGPTSSTQSYFLVSALGPSKYSTMRPRGAYSAETSDLRTAPRFQPGRPVTKDSDLDTIPESDTASVLLKPPVNGNYKPRESNDNDDHSIAESRASSELSAQWHQSPRERLGLGGFIKHSTKEAPWPLPSQEDEDYIVDNERSRSTTPTQGERDKRNSRRTSIMGVFKR